MKQEWMGLEKLLQPALNSSSGAPVPSTRHQLLSAPQLLPGLPAGPGREQPQRE